MPTGIIPCRLKKTKVTYKTDNNLYNRKANVGDNDKMMYLYE